MYLSLSHFLTLGLGVDDNFSNWGLGDAYAGGVLDNTGGMAERYNFILFKLYRETGLRSYTWAIDNAIKTPSFFIKMGYTNAKEFYAWGAFALAWAGVLNRDQGLLNKASDYLDNFITRPDDVDSDLWRTPTTKNKDRQESFAQKVNEFAQERYSIDIQPFIYGSDLSGVRAFCDQMIKDAEDTTVLAIQTKQDKKEESVDYAKLAFGAVLILGTISLIKK